VKVLQYGCIQDHITSYNLFWEVQYGARDKYLSGVVGGYTASEYVAIAASAASESGMKAKRIAREYGALLLTLVSGDATNKSLSGVEDKTTTDNTCLLYMSCMRVYTYDRRFQYIHVDSI